MGKFKESSARHRSFTDDIVFTTHALERMAERHITRDMVFLAISYGKQFAARGDGITYHMDADAVARAARDGFRTDGLRDVAIILKEGRIVATVERLKERPAAYKWCGL